MSTTGATGIVVGIEGTVVSQGALEWAIREAAMRGSALTVVHAWDFIAARDAGRMTEHEEKTASDCML
ncbi:MAG TPA: universal stress protein, partial [Nakamurella sp.]